MSEPVLLDTSILTAAVAAKVDLVEEFRRIGCIGPLYVFKGTFGELERIKARRSSQSAYAGVALQLLTKWNVQVLEETQGHVDDALVEYAKEHRCVVGAQDSGLRKRLKDLGTPTAYIRQKSYLALDKL